MSRLKEDLDKAFTRQSMANSKYFAFARKAEHEGHRQAAKLFRAAAEAEAIRYLILHELIHLHEHNHGPSFYERLKRAIPEYREIEAWLETNGDNYTL